MTDPTRDEVEPQRRAVSFLRSQHKQLCFEQGDHKDEVDTAYSLGVDAIERCAALRERAEAAEAERDRLSAVWQVENDKTNALEDALTAARRAEAAAWNDAIEAAQKKAEQYIAMGWRGAELPEAIRALRRAAPTEGEA